ncbi:hypothetical protein [Microbacterium sp.]|uniref:hypothetical protein n=1 Tax=Microbacterium sp. TaxID=51671 RepID=UPI003C1443E2
MNGQTAMLLGVAVVSVCNIGFVLVLPGLAGAAMRGNRSGVLRLATLLGMLAVVALAASAVLGATADAYSFLT